MTTAKPLPPHGTNARYGRGCRQPCCRDAHNADKRRRYRLKGYGQWQPFTDAEPVRQHLLLLQSADVGWKLAARLAGIHPSLVGPILHPKNGRVRSKVRPETAEKILAVQIPTLLTTADNKPVDGPGTRRRLEALGCRGYSCARIGREIGAWPETVRVWLRGNPVEARYARAVAELFVRWEMHDAEANGSTALSAGQAKALAKRRGWQPPMAWDLESIDDPDAKPFDCVRIDTQHRAEGLVEDAEFIVRTTGVELDLVRERLGVSRNGLDKARERVRARAHAAERQELAA